MCGRVYETYTDEELYFQYLGNVPLDPIPFVPVYNLCPTENSPVLRLIAGQRHFEQMRWQLVPDWEPAFSTKLSTINARSESVFDSRLFGRLVLSQRCIVPISGFYEWKTAGPTKRPFKIHLRNNRIMSVAGVWDTWRPGTTDERRSFSILTTTANRFMREIHERMPVILSRSGEDGWLDPGTHDHQTLEELLRPCPDEWLSAVEVSPLVNSPKNNSPEVLEPAVTTAAAEPQQRRLFGD